MSSAVAYSTSVGSPAWHEKAACAGRDQVEFFGHEEQPGKKRHRPTLNMAEVRRAKDICFHCPVLDQCYEFAMTNREEFGIWGGTTGRERRRIWRAEGVDMPEIDD